MSQNDWQDNRPEKKENTSLKKLKRIVLSLLGVCFTLFILYYGFVIFMMSRADFTFNGVLNEASDEAAVLLRAKGICRNVNCGGEVFFFDPSDRRVTIYGVTDQTVLKDFSQIFVKKFLQTGAMKDLEIIGYQKPKEDGIFPSSKVIFDFKMEKRFE